MKEIPRRDLVSAALPLVKPAAKRFLIFLERIPIMVAVPIAVLLIWEAVAVWLGPLVILPRVEDAFTHLFHPFSDIIGTGSLASNAAVSAFRVVLGFLLAAIIGVPLGLIMGSSDLIRRLISPMVDVLRPLCPVAWLPFSMAVFKTTTVTNIWGIRYSNTIFDEVQLGMLFIIFWGGFFPILLNTIDGVIGVKKIYVESALTLGARGRQTFTKVILPAATPSIATGLVVGLGISWMVLVAAEMLPGTNSGLGYLIIFAYELARMDVIIGGMIAIGIIGALLSWMLRMSTNRLTKWQAKER